MFAIIVRSNKSMVALNEDFIEEQLCRGESANYFKVNLTRIPAVWRKIQTQKFKNSNISILSTRNFKYRYRQEIFNIDKKFEYKKFRIQAKKSNFFDEYQQKYRQKIQILTKNFKYRQTNSNFLTNMDKKYRQKISNFLTNMNKKIQTKNFELFWNNVDKKYKQKILTIPD